MAKRGAVCAVVETGLTTTERADFFGIRRRVLNRIEGGPWLRLMPCDGNKVVEPTRSTHVDGHRAPQSDEGDYGIEQAADHEQKNEAIERTISFGSRVFWYENLLYFSQEQRESLCEIRNSWVSVPN